MASTSISKTFSNAGNRQKWTWSAWIKRSATSNSSAANGYTLWNCEGSSTSDNFIFQITVNGGGSGGATDSIALHTYGSDVFRTTPLLRDVSAWYHIVLALDTTQATATNRIKLYVNGELQSYSQESNFPAQNFSMGINRAAKHCIGSHGTNANYYFDGLMSHVHFCDGYQYAASDFGETDSTTGEWKIKTSPSVSYGTNGFWILKDGNSLTDQSPNSNNFSSNGGTLTKTEDCPSNVFATLNPLVKDAGSTSYHHGNTQHNVDTANWRSAYSTLGMTTGKYYFEALKSNGSHGMIGVRGVEQCDGSLAGNNDFIGVVTQGWSLYNADGVVKNNNSDVGSSIGTYANGDYIGCFLDCDNSKLYFSKNGTMMNTTGYSITAGLTYMFGVSGHSTYRWVCNFGNGAFGSTQLTGTTYNGSDGNGIFKYNPNSITLDGSSKSFKSLSTKGLNL
jgi:hypothetical protein